MTYRYKTSVPRVTAATAAALRERFGPAVVVTPVESPQEALEVALASFYERASMGECACDAPLVEALPGSDSSPMGPHRWRLEGDCYFLDIRMMD